MNWYKKASLNNKMSFSFKKFLLSLGGLSLLALVTSLGINETKFNQLMQKHNNDLKAVQIELKEEANNKNIPIKEEIPEWASKEADESKQTQQNINKDIQKKTPNNIEQNDKKFDSKAFAIKLVDLEGAENVAYDDYSGESVNKLKRITGYITVGIGHKMTDKKGTFIPSQNSIKVFNDLNEKYKKQSKPLLNHDAVMHGKQVLTQEQIIDLAEYDVLEHADRTKSLFPKFDTYAKDLQEALVNGVYRGEYTRDSDVVKNINKGNFKNAVKLYLGRYDYTHAKQRNQRGIIPRMNENAKAMINTALALGQLSQKEADLMIKKMRDYQGK